MAKLQTAVNKVKQLEKKLTPTNSTTSNSTANGGLPDGLGAGAVNTALRDAPRPVQSATAASYGEDQVKRMYDLLEQRQRAALEEKKKRLLLDIQREREKIEPTYQAAKSNIAGQSATQARTTAEYLANRGQTQSGLAAQAEMQRGANLTNQLSALEKQIADAYAALAERETQVKSDYTAGITDASLDRQIKEIAALRALQDQQRQDAIATIGQYYDDYAAKIKEIEALEAQGDTSQSYLIPYLLMARHQKLAEQAEAQKAAEQEAWERWLELQKLEIQRQRAARSGSSSSGDPEMTKDEALAIDYNKAASGLITKQEIERNREALIAQYGLTNYNHILKAADEYLRNLAENREGMFDEFSREADVLEQYYKQHPNAPIIRNQLMEAGVGTNWKGRTY